MEIGNEICGFSHGFNWIFSGTMYFVLEFEVSGMFYE
jgi:hypothetical protein